MSKFTTRLSIRRSTFTALFAALICAGCFISIPLVGGVPVTIQNMLAILSGLLLGGAHGAGAVGIFLILGCIGLPVFAGMTSGFAIIQGPTGGFLIGYFLAALAAGLILGTPDIRERKFSIKRWLLIVLAVVVAYILNYLPGIPWFMHVMAGKGKPQTLSAALGVCLIPFIPGDVLKMIVSVPLTALLRPVIARYLYPDNDREAAEVIAGLKAKNGKSGGDGASDGQ